MSKPVQASSSAFQKIIEGGFLYVDKTSYLYELVHRPVGYYFIARPRRFGKSLLVSTLEAIFQGDKELFKGLWLYESDYQWQKYPIIRMDFSRLPVTTADEFKAGIERYLRRIAHQYNTTLGDGPYYSLFEDLISALATEQQVVILIDEYDRPLVENLHNLTEATAIRTVMRGFYSIIKAMDQDIRFVFITGISKFSKVGVFSVMNNLDDLTADPRFATMLGITEEELRHDFQEHIAELAGVEGVDAEKLLQKIQKWYDGFCFVEDAPRVYNPYSTLQLFNKQRFKNYWFETGTPTFLINLMQDNDYDIRQLDTLEVGELGFSTFDLEDLAILPLLFQTGYLTIKSYDKTRELYKLYYPNYEVENAFLTYLLQAFTTTPHGLSEGYLWKMIDALSAQNLKEFFVVLNVIFANIPYNIHLKQEKYYQSIFVLIFKLIGLRIDAEVYTNEGRIDAVIELSDTIYLFEFKLDKSEDEALQQIKNTEYYQKYRLQTKTLALIGVNFDSTVRKVTGWKEQLDQPV